MKQSKLMQFIEDKAIEQHPELGIVNHLSDLKGNEQAALKKKFGRDVIVTWVAWSSHDKTRAEVNNKTWMLTTDWADDITIKELK